jgi:hypothetical protein
MNDPTRLVDEAGADELEGSLLRLARQDGPSAASRQKILAGVVAGGAASLTAPSAQAATTVGRSLSLGKWLLLAVAAGGIPAAVLLATGKEVAPPPSAPSAPHAVAPPPPAVAPLQDEPAAAKQEALPTPREAPGPRSSSPAAKASPASLADEVAQLKKAKLALESGNSRLALAELATYSQRFPRPTLGTEAAVLRIEALSRSGDAKRAKALAESFVARHPNSPYAARLRSLTGAR